VSFEGAGDALCDPARDAVWMGWGFRSDFTARAHLSRHLEVEVLPLRLADARFYHLDKCFCPLSGGHLLYYPPAFDKRSLDLIRARVPHDKLIAAAEADAEAFACNAVNIGDVVILNRASGALRGRLRAAGFRVVQADSSEFLKAGGATKCLTLRLDEAPPPPPAFREGVFAAGAFSGELAEGAL
jgi:N-dimethylarginine dimethylaminohydrolase